MRQHLPWCRVFAALAIASSAAQAGDSVPVDRALASGEWSDSVPIDVPPAPNSSQPSVSLVASHGTVDGELGAGWKLAATSMITRHSKTGGVPNFTTTELDRLDGMDLVWVTAAGGAGSAHFEPEHYDGSRLDYQANANVWTRKRDGWTWTYGSTGGTGTGATRLLGNAGEVVKMPPLVGGNCLTAQCKTAAWYLSKVQDPWGNVATYNYRIAPVPGELVSTYTSTMKFVDSRQILLDSIVYDGGKSKISFTYAPRLDTRFAVQFGRPTLMVQRLSEITTTRTIGIQTPIHSHYAIQYENQTDTTVLGTLTDCSGRGTPGVTTATPTILKKIVRLSTKDSAKRTLRCIDSRHEATHWQSDAEATALGMVTPMSDTTEMHKNSVIPIAARLDADGIDDLLVIGINDGLVEVHAYIATPHAATAFATAASPGPAGASALLWEQKLQDPLDTLGNGTGFAFGDLDGNHTANVLYEEVITGQPTKVKVWYPEWGDRTATVPIDRCDLRFGELVDVDGDQYLDLVIRAHDDPVDCGSQPKTRWIRNSGAEPWFGGAKAVLDVPLEATTKPQAWVTATSPTVCPTGVSGPTDLNTSWDVATPEAYIADHARFADFNGDGVVDIAYAMYGCWDHVADDSGTPDYDPQWNPVVASTYSRIFFGDGSGRFIDSGLSAGPPLTYDLESAASSAIVTDRLVAGLLSPIDVDHDGIAEIMTTKAVSEGTAARINTYHSLLADLSAPEAQRGWGLTTDINTNTNGIDPEGLDYLSPAAICYERVGTQAMGDFDGDGMIDAITIEAAEAIATPLCPAGQWCTVLRKNLRTGTEGRMVRSYGPWGGKTELEWGFSAEAPHDNPTLRANLEVIQAIDGADGPLALTYSGGFTHGRLPTTFAQVDRRNSRGGTDSMYFNAAPWGLGTPTHAARYRADGSLEHLSVWIHGTMLDTGQIVFWYAIPYFNPLQRHCEYDVGNAATDGSQSVTVDSLFSRCLTFDGVAPPPVSTPPWDPTYTVGHDALPVVYGQTGGLTLPGGQTDYTSSFGAGAISYGTVTATSAWQYAPAGGLQPVAPFLRWPVPAELVGHVPGVEAAEHNYVAPHDASPTPVVETVEDWQWDTVLRKLQRWVEYRDTATLLDDRRHDYTYDRPDLSGYWWVLRHDAVTDSSGLISLYHDRWSYLVAPPWVPVTAERCDASLATCRTTTYGYDASGSLTSLQHPDGGTESWKRTICGLPLTHTDEVSRIATNTLEACRIHSTAFEGALTTWEYDGFGRVVTQTIDPGGGGESMSTETTYDDHFTYPEDSAFQEPRITTVEADGRVAQQYLDGFGRATKQVECAVGVPETTCATGTERTSYQLYGGDGLLRVASAPFRAGETPVTRGMALDASALPVALLEPWHGLGQDWTTTTIYRGADYELAIDPSGRELETKFSTLTFQTFVAGVSREQRVFDLLGRLRFVHAPDGLVTQLDYNDFGDLNAETRLTDATCIDATGASATCHWKREVTEVDAMGRVLAEKDPALTELRYTYDALGRRKTASIGGTTVESRVYLPVVARRAQSTVEITDEHGAVRTVTLDGLGRTTSIALLELTESIAYGANGLPASSVDRNGRTTEYHYDVHRHPTEIVAPGGSTTTLGYDGPGRVTSRRDADAVELTFEYTYAGDPRLTRRAATWTESEAFYDALGRPFDVTDNGVRSIYTYDSLGRVDFVDVGVGGASAETQVDYGYDAGDRVTSKTVTPRGRRAATTRYGYDAWGRRISITDPGLHVWSFEHDILGRGRFQTDPTEYRSETQYDVRGRVTADQFPGGWRYFAYPAAQTYGGVSQLARVDSWDSQDATLLPIPKTSRYVDVAGREVATVDDRTGVAHLPAWSGSELTGETWAKGTSLLASRDYTYEATTGRLLSVVGPYAPADLVTGRDRVDYDYTAAGRTAHEIHPEQITAFTYVGGLLRTESWDDQVRTVFRDELAPRVTSEELSGAGSIRRTTLLRDKSGRVTRETVTAPGRSTVVTVRSGFTAFDAPTTETRSVGGGLETTTTWTYEETGRPTTRNVATTGAAAALTSWVWRINGQLERVTAPSGEAIGYDYGSDPLVDRVYDFNSLRRDYAVVGSRDARGQVLTVDHPVDGLRHQLTYDAAGRLSTRSIVSSVGTTVATWTNHYDDLGRLSGEDTATPITSWSDVFAHDGSGRLLSEVRGKTGETRTYTWSRGGNLLSTDRTLAGATTRVMTAAYTGQRLTTVNGVALAYDPFQAVTADQHGNAFTYTADGEVRTITGPAPATAVTLQRDADGVSVAHLEGGAQPRRITWGLDAADLPLEVRQSDGADHTYVSGLGQLFGTVHAGTFTSSDSDLRSTPIRSGLELLARGTAFGEGLAPPTGTDERFLFARLETVKGAVGIHLARHRTYDAQVGRFQSPDPLGLAGGSHRSLYGDADPISNVDPMGWSSICLLDPPTHAGLPVINTRLTVTPMQDQWEFDVKVQQDLVNHIAQATALPWFHMADDPELCDISPDCGAPTPPMAATDPSGESTEATPPRGGFSLTNGWTDSYCIDDGNCIVSFHPPKRKHRDGPVELGWDGLDAGLRNLFARLRRPKWWPAAIDAIQYVAGRDRVLDLGQLGDLRRAGHLAVEIPSVLSGEPRHDGRRHPDGVHNLAHQAVDLLTDPQSYRTGVHVGLDVLGIVSPIADLANADLYALEGDQLNAAISAVSIIPWGDAAKLARAPKVVGAVADLAPLLLNPTDAYGGMGSFDDVLEVLARHEDDIAEVPWNPMSGLPPPNDAHLDQIGTVFESMWPGIPAREDDILGPWPAMPSHPRWGDHLENRLGVPRPEPGEMSRPHAHHVVYEVGIGKRQKELAAIGHGILRNRAGIDPIFGEANLTWAPNKAGQHTIDNLQRVVRHLQFLDSINASPYEFERALRGFGKAAAER